MIFSSIIVRLQSVGRDRHFSYPFQADTLARIFSLLAVLLLLTPFVSTPVFASGDNLADCRKALSSTISELNKRSPAALNRIIDADQIIDTALSDLYMDLSFKRDFSRGLKKGISHIGEQFLKQIPEGHLAKIIRVQQDRNVVLGLVRMDFGDSGWGYMDFWLKKDAKGKVRIVDWYNFASGELYTASLKQIAAMESPTPTPFGKVFDLVSGRGDDAKVLGKFLHARAKGQFDKSYAIFKTMNAELKKNRSVGLIAVYSANSSGNNTYYKEALANLAKYHGKDPTLAFLLIDHYFFTGNYKQVIHNLDRFQASIGTPTEDAAIDNLKANAYMKAGDNRLAVKFASRGMRFEPELEPNYWTLFTVYSTNGQYAQAVAIGKQLENRFHYNLGPASLRNAKGFEPLLKSAAYRKWQGIN